MVFIGESPYAYDFKSVIIIYDSMLSIAHGDVAAWGIKNFSFGAARSGTILSGHGLPMGKGKRFAKFGLSCIVSTSGRILAGIEAGEFVVAQDLAIEGVEECRQIAIYLKDRQDHLDLYRKQLDL